MKYYINIKADTNDGDYISQMCEISEEELKLIRPVVESIKAFKPYKVKGLSHDNNFPCGDCCCKRLGQKEAEEYYVDGGLVTQEQFDAFMEFVPQGEYGIHTIESVEVFHVTEVHSLI
jgi:hypothetical protein